MDDPKMHAYGEDGPTDAEIGREQWRDEVRALMRQALAL